MDPLQGILELYEWNITISKANKLKKDFQVYVKESINEERPWIKIGRLWKVETNSIKLRGEVANNLSYTL